MSKINKKVKLHQKTNWKSLNNEDLENALSLTEHFFRKRFYEPNNLNFPKSRNHLKISIIK